MRKIYVLIGALCTLSVVSCESENAEELYPVTDCTTEDLTYTNSIKLIVDNNCATSGCHVDGTGLPVLETYAQVKDIGGRGRIQDRVLDNKTMPPNKALSTCNLSQIQAWLDNGSPE